MCIKSGFIASGSCGDFTVDIEEEECEFTSWNLLISNKNFHLQANIDSIDSFYKLVDFLKKMPADNSFLLSHKETGVSFSIHDKRLAIRIKTNEVKSGNQLFEVIINSDTVKELQMACADACKELSELSNSRKINSQN